MQCFRDIVCLSKCLHLGQNIFKMKSIYNVMPEIVKIMFSSRTLVCAVWL